MKQSPLLEQLISAFCCLPGIGRKSAQRMSYHLLERDRQNGIHLGRRLIEALESIGHCEQCRNFTESVRCGICENPKRDPKQICVVESPADVLAIENAQIFYGRYFVLMGHLSPLDGIGPDDLGLDSLEHQLKNDEISEVIIATGATIEGEATAHYLQGLVAKYEVASSRPAQGIPMGGELEYVDSNTLARSITERKSY